MEVVDLGALSEIDDLPSMEPSRTGSNLGSGIELLMNEKKVSYNTDLNLGELDTLEDELNEISGRNTPQAEMNSNTKTLSGMASNLFGFGSNPEPSHPSYGEQSESNLGQATRDSIGTAKTWDGFAKMSEMPLNDDIKVHTTMSEREQRRKKRAMLKKLEFEADTEFLGLTSAGPFVNTITIFKNSVYNAATNVHEKHYLKL